MNINTRVTFACTYMFLYTSANVYHTCVYEPLELLDHIISVATDQCASSSSLEIIFSVFTSLHNN